MKLPNHHLAIIDLAKLRDYVLNPDHPRGKHKARVFMRVLGFGAPDAEELMHQIRQGLEQKSCVMREDDDFGRRFHVDVPVVGRTGTGIVRTGWILLTGETFPRLTTCFVKC